MTYATTFSGIGGWELGLNACGWDLQWQCEREPFCRTLLKERFGVPIYDDIRTIREHTPPKVDALIGSPPCQPFSTAGAKRGLGDDRHLYPSFIALVRQLEPRWVLMEQVPNIFSIRGAFGAYLGGLAALGYDIVWHCIPASAAGAPHRRDRIWIIAHSLQGVRGTKHEQQQGQWAKEFTGGGEAVADSTKLGCELSRATRTRRNGFANGSDNASNSVRQGLPGQRELTCGTGQEQHHIGNGGWWETEPAVGRVANGIPHRIHRLQGLGNAVVPQIPFLIGQAVNEVESVI